MNRWLKVLLAPVALTLVILVVYLLIDYGDAASLLKSYNAVTPDNSSGFNRQLQFLKEYTLATGDLSLAISAGLSQEDAESMAQGTFDPNPTGDAYTPVITNASVQEIINMSDAEVWLLISEGAHSSYSSVNEACKANPTAEEAFWRDKLQTTTVNCWKWADSSKTTKVASTIDITVNKHLVEYYTSFLNDLYNCPEQYVIEIIGGFNFRTKNNNSGTGNYSSHSFGATLDINWNTQGMSYNSVPYKWDSIKNDIVLSSTSCAFGSSWETLANTYKLDWGGHWSRSSLDGMHFSLVGDNNKDSRQYSPKVEGR